MTLLSHRPRLSGLAIWNMCVGFFGIQIGFGLQNANTSRIFQTLGAEVDSLAILWIAAPLTGLLVQPIIGHFSDKTWTRFGRRRPYFLVGAILTTLALIAMPNSPSLWFAAAMLWIMDASINITMEPFRAFVGDNLPEEQRTTGYAMQSFFIGAGAVFASTLPWILSNVFHVASTAPAGVVPLSVKIAFYVGAAGLFSAVLWTVLSTKEYSPEQIAAFERAFDEAVAAGVDAILIDTPGGDTAVSSAAHARADQIVTPMNDSFVDFDLLGEVDPVSLELLKPSIYSESVWEARKHRAITEGRQVTIDWIVVTNRLAVAEARNRRRLEERMKKLAKRVGFRVGPGLRDRVIYRELFPFGLTVADLSNDIRPVSVSLAHVAARQEMRNLMQAMGLDDAAGGSLAPLDAAAA